MKNYPMDTIIIIITLMKILKENIIVLIQKIVKFIVRK